MPFDRKELVALSQGSFISSQTGTYTGWRNTQYSYATPDTKAAVLTAGYFTDTAVLAATGATLFKVGDTIDCVFAVGSAIGGIKLIVTAVANGVATVAAFATS